jgi:SNF2 family DNA or RNA helicase
MVRQRFGTKKKNWERKQTSVPQGANCVRKVCAVAKKNFFFWFDAFFFHVHLSSRLKLTRLTSFYKFRHPLPVSFLEPNVSRVAMRPRFEFYDFFPNLTDVSGAAILTHNPSNLTQMQSYSNNIDYSANSASSSSLDQQHSHQHSHQPLKKQPIKISINKANSPLASLASQLSNTGSSSFPSACASSYNTFYQSSNLGNSIHTSSSSTISSSITSFGASSSNALTDSFFNTSSSDFNPPNSISSIQSNSIGSYSQNQYNSSVSDPSGVFRSAPSLLDPNALIAQTTPFLSPPPFNPPQPPPQTSTTKRTSQTLRRTSSNSVSSSSHSIAQEEKHVGTFGTELEQVSSINASSLKSGDAVFFEVDYTSPIQLPSTSSSPLSESYRVLVHVGDISKPIGFIPSRISAWLSLVLPHLNTRFTAKSLARSSPTSVVIVIDAFIVKLDVDSWQNLSFHEKGAWHQLAVALGVPVTDIAPSRALSQQSGSSPLLAAASTPFQSTSTPKAKNPTSLSGGAKRTQDITIAPESKRSKILINSSPLLGTSFVSVAGAFGSTSSSPSSSSQLNKPLAFGQSSIPLAVSYPATSSSTNLGVQTSSDMMMLDQTQSQQQNGDESYIERLLQGLVQSQELAPNVEPSPNFIAQLRPYQLDSLRWMVARERPIEDGDSNQSWRSTSGGESPQQRSQQDLPTQHQLQNSSSNGELNENLSFGVTNQPLAMGSSTFSTHQPKFMILPPPGWQELKTSTGKPYYLNTETKQTLWTFPYDQWASHYDKTLSPMLPAEVCGGILADDMGSWWVFSPLFFSLCLLFLLFVFLPGMGKTVQMISLITTNTPAKEESRDRCTSTLVVCPLTLLEQWASEIRSHTKPGTLSVYTYHGSERSRDPAYLSTFDVVLTTYATLAAEFSMKSNEPNGPLMNVDWYRLVLDEAHTIKDRTTRTAKAAMALSGSRRWAVSGTPIQNKLVRFYHNSTIWSVLNQTFNEIFLNTLQSEIFSLLNFIRVHPFGDIEWWNQIIMKPIRNRDERGLERLRSVLSCVLLRRTKDQKVDGGKSVVELPPRSVVVRKEIFSSEENEFYQHLWESAKSRFQSMVAEGTVLQNYAHILELLLRLRQACDHPGLVTSSNSKGAKLRNVALGISQNEDEANNSDSQRFSRVLQNEENALIQAEEAAAAVAQELLECAVCQEPVESCDALLTKCHHVFCRSCLAQSWASQHPLQHDNYLDFDALYNSTFDCPMCSSPLQYAHDLTPLGSATPQQNAAGESVEFSESVPKEDEDDQDYQSPDENMDVVISGPHWGAGSGSSGSGGSSQKPGSAMPGASTVENRRWPGAGAAAAATSVKKEQAFDLRSSTAAMVIKREDNGDADYEGNDGMEVEQHAPAAPAPSAPSLFASTSSLSTSGSHSNPLSRSGFNPSWTYLAPPTNYPVVSADLPDGPLSVPMSEAPVAPTAAPVRSARAANARSSMEISNGATNKRSSDLIHSAYQSKRSTKIRALLEELKRVKREDEDSKSIIFSQWTTMVRLNVHYNLIGLGKLTVLLFAQLDLLELALGEEGIVYARLDGKMSQRSRETAIRSFTNNRNIKVFLISMKAGGLGLNLVAANRVFLLDPWWNRTCFIHLQPDPIPT